MEQIKLKLQLCLLFILDLISSLFWFPAMAVFISPFFLYKTVVTFLASCFRPDLIPLDTKDQLMAWDLLIPKKLNERHVYNIGVSVRVGGRVKLEAFKAKYVESIRNARNSAGQKLFPRLEQRLELYGGYAFRRDTKTPSNVDDKILEVALGNKCVASFEAEWIGRGYAEESSPWEVVLLPMEEAGETYVLIKIHHSLVDAYSTLNFLNRLLDNDVPVPARVPEDTCWQIFLQLIKCPRVSLLFSMEVLASSFAPLPWSGDNSVGTIFQSSTALCLTDLKRVQRKTGSFFTPIALCLFGGVMARIITEQELAKAKSQNPIRTSGTRQEKRSTFVQISLPLPNHPITEMCNHWTSGAFRVPLGQMKATERLKSIEADFKRYHERGLDKLMHWVMLPPGSLIPTKLFVHIYEGIRRSSRLGTIFTSVVGFQDDFYSLEGHPVVSIAPLLGLLGKSPVITGLALSYNDRYELTLIAMSQVAETQVMMDKIVSTYFAEELQNLLNELESK